MKKKFSLLVLICTFALVFAGCGASSKESERLEDATLQQYADYVVQSFQQMDITSLDALKGASEFQLDYTLMQSGLPIEAQDFVTMIESWEAATKEYGALVDYGEYEITEESGNVTLTTVGEFENQEANIAFTFDDGVQMSAMTVNVQYTIGEILQRAGLNTLLGMGTVFAVLIFISFIISLFRFIPDLEAKLSKKSQAPAAKLEAPAVPAPVAAVPEVTAEMNDAELVAVIAAAIAASEGTTTDGFIVRSIKRRKNNNW